MPTLVTLGSNITNVTGNGTEYPVAFDTTVLGGSFWDTNKLVYEGGSTLYMGIGATLLLAGYALTSADTTIKLAVTDSTGAFEIPLFQAGNALLGTSNNLTQSVYVPLIVVQPDEETTAEIQLIVAVGGLTQGVDVLAGSRLYSSY